MKTTSLLVSVLLLAPVLGLLAACGDDDAAEPSAFPGGTDDPDPTDEEIAFGERVGVVDGDFTVRFTEEPGGWWAIEVVNDSTEPVAVGGGATFRDEDRDPRLVVQSFMLLDTSPDEGRADAPEFDQGTFVAPGDHQRMGNARLDEGAVRFCYEVISTDAVSGASEASTGDTVRLHGSTEDYRRRLACGTLPAA